MIDYDTVKDFIDYVREHYTRLQDKEEQSLTVRN